ncbi:MAG: restriction endonuclease subunit S [Haemophilus parainfluenzae]|jgi:restriction modification system DNA specificity domain protein|nr:restriction endonuclease subunit S [Haemophilus parainfluenzae]
MNKQQEPGLRFKGFSGEWKEKYLDDIGEFSAGGDLKKEKLTLFGRYPVLANALTNNGIVGFYDDYEFESPAITITGRGDVGIAKARKENFSAVVRLLVLKNKPNYDVDFLEQAINNIDFHIESTGVPQLTVPQCKSYSIYLPSEPEQTQLGNFFRRLDSQIAESRAVLEKSCQLKKAMLAKMFPANGEKIPKIRFKGFEGEWECRKLGEMADIVRGASPRPIQDSKWFDDNSDIGWLRISDVTIQNGRIHYLEQKISKAGQEKTRVLEEPHLLLSIAASVGKPVINYVKTGVHDGFLVFKNPNFELEFMFQYLDSFVDTWQCYGQPGTQVNLNSDIVKNAEFFIPPNPKEQTAIGNFFCQLDKTIALQSAEVEKLNQLKKGLLAAMLM